MKLIFVRHGQTEWNAAHRVQGRTDIPLNEAGRTQAHTVALAMREFHPVAVYSSPLSRAHDTAMEIARESGLESVTDMDGLLEIHFGAWEGKNAEEIRRDFPEHWKDWNWLSDEKMCRMLESETGMEVQQRAMEAVRRIVASHDERDTVVIVSHTMPIKRFIAFVIGSERMDMRSLRLNNCSLTVVNRDAGAENSLESLSQGKYTLEMWNECAHLRAAGLL